MGSISVLRSCVMCVDVCECGKVETCSQVLLHVKYLVSTVRVGGGGRLTLFNKSYLFISPARIYMYHQNRVPIQTPD